MTRQFTTYSDKLCASCDLSIPGWEKSSKDGKSVEPPAGWVVPGWCSWCFGSTNHSLIQKNYIKRNLYQCQSCSKQTVKCAKCSLGTNFMCINTSDANTTKPWRERQSILAI